MLIKKIISLAVAITMAITMVMSSSFQTPIVFATSFTNTFNWSSMNGYDGSIGRTNSGIQMQGSSKQALLNYFYNDKFSNLDGFHTTITIDNVTPFVGNGHQSYIGIQFTSDKNEAAIFNNAYTGFMIILAPNQGTNIYNIYVLANGGTGIVAPQNNISPNLMAIPNGGAIDVMLKKDVGGNWHIFINGSDVGCDISAAKSTLDNGGYFGIKAYENNAMVAFEQAVSVTVRQINGEALGNHLDIATESVIKSSKGNVDAGSSIMPTTSGLKMSANIYTSAYMGFKYATGSPVKDLNGFSTSFKIDHLDGYNGINGVSNNINFGLTTFNATADTGLPAGYVNADRMDVWDYFNAPVSTARGVQIRFYRLSDTLCQTLIFIIGSNGQLDAPADFLNGNNVEVGADGVFNVSIIKNDLNWTLMVNGQNVFASSNDSTKLAAFNAELNAISQYGATPSYSSAYDNLGNLVSANSVITVKSINNRPIGLNAEKPVDGITLNKSTTTILTGGTETLTATISPTDATNKNIVWTSSNSLVATADHGVVTALSAGLATITATTQDASFIAECDIIVKDPITFGRLMVSDNKITNVDQNTTVDNINAIISTETGVVAQYKNKQGAIISGNVNVGTGTMIAVTANNKTTIYTIVVFGDVDGSGTIDSYDLVKMKKHLLKLAFLNGSNATAGKMFSSSHMTIRDLITAKKQILGIRNINQNQGVELQNVYNFSKLITPYWQGDTIYNESVMALSNQDSSISDISLLHKADSILSVRNAQLNTEYAEGVDWQLIDGKIKIPAGSAIPVTAYSDYYLTSPLQNHSFACTNGGYIYFSEGATFHNKQIAVAYTHSQAWDGPTPVYKADKLPKTMDKLVNNKPLKVLFYGDSITEGANATAFVGVAPFTPRWTELFINNMKTRFNNNNITSVNTAVGGQNSLWGAQNATARGADQHPDLAVIAFGMNDGTVFSPDQFKTNIASIMSTIRATNPDCEFILVASMIPNKEVTGFLGNQPYYHTALESLETTGVVMTNVTEMHQYLLTQKRYFDMTGNNVNHPNDFLVRLYAQTVSALVIH